MYEKDTIALVVVNDTRYGDSFKPPYRHKGLELRNTSVENIGALFTDYLEDLIADAEKFGC